MSPPVRLPAPVPVLSQSPMVESAPAPRRRSAWLVAVIAAAAVLLAGGSYAAARLTILRDSTASPVRAQAAAAVRATPTGIPVSSARPSSPKATGAVAVPVPVPVTPSATAGDYIRYSNKRFGFSCEVPASFVAQPELDAGEGITHQSRDGQAEITCLASNIVSAGDGGTSARQAADQALVRLRSQGATVTYQALVGDAMTLSGISKDGKVYYWLTVWGPGSVQKLQWTYPRSQLGPLTAAVEHSAATFQAGDLTSSH